MKKIFSLSFVIICFISQSLTAQINSKGTSSMQIGYGYPSAMQMMGSFFKFAVTTVGEDYSSSFSYKGFGPLHFRYNYMLGGRVGLGLSANYEMGDFKFSESYTDVDNNDITSSSKFHVSSINALVRCNIHFIKEPKRVDIYYGVGVGYAHTRVKLEEVLIGENVDPVDQIQIDATNKEFTDFLNGVFKTIPVAIESVFGIKAPFNQDTGMYFEVGYSKAFCQLGFYMKMGGPRGYNRDKWQWF